MKRRTQFFTRVFIALMSIHLACASDDATSPENDGPPAAARIGGTGDDAATCVARVSSGFLMGSAFTGTIVVGGETINGTGTNAMIVSRHDADGTVLWTAHSMHFPGAYGAPTGIGVQSTGDIVVTGLYEQDIRLDTITLSAGNLFIAGYDAAGRVSWAQDASSSGILYSSDIAVDASNNFVVVGSFENTAFFATDDVASAGATDAFIAKFNAAGGLIWLQRVGGTTDDLGTGVSIDAGGNIYVSGTFSGTVSFGPANLVAQGAADGFVLKLDAGGARQWVKGIGGSGLEFGSFCAAAPDGGVFVTGVFSTNFNPGGGTLTTRGGRDGYVVRFDASGNFQWATSMGSNLDDSAGSISSSTSGVYLGGIYRGDFFVGAEASRRFGTAGGVDGYVVKLSNAGAVQWASRFGGSDDDHFGAIAPVSSGLAVVGGFRGSATIAGQSLTSAGGLDILRWIR